jgi:hypothetical protein
MKSQEIKKLLIRSLDNDCESAEISRQIEDAGISYKFSEAFTERVLDRIYNAGSAIVNEKEFLRSMNIAFYRIAFTGIAAIVLMLISILIGQGTFSLDSFLGLSDSYDESLICLLTGN